MKHSQLKQLIKEEIRNTLNEGKHLSKMLGAANLKFGVDGNLYFIIGSDSYSGAANLQISKKDLPKFFKMVRDAEAQVNSLSGTLNEGEFYPSTRIGSITNQKDIDEFDKDLFVQKMYEQGRIRVDELDISYDDEWQIFIDKKDKVVIKFLKNNYPQHLQIDSYLAKQLAG